MSLKYLYSNIAIHIRYHTIWLMKCSNYIRYSNLCKHNKTIKEFIELDHQLLDDSNVY